MNIPKWIKRIWCKHSERIETIWYKDRVIQKGGKLTAGCKIRYDVYAEVHCVDCNKLLIKKHKIRKQQTWYQIRLIFKDSEII